ncbi:MAG TPA: lysophospholipid acyltransferase family protein [Opitutaceae bacterium]
MRLFARVYFQIAYLLSWLLFAVGGLLLNFGCAVRALGPRTPALSVRVRSIIRWLFESLVKWFHACGVAKVSWKNFNTPLRAGTVYIANHPSLLDAPIVLGRLPNAITIFKPALLRNPLIAPAAILAGYASGDGGVDVIRDAAEKVQSGCSLLIFPEGTRTRPGETLGNFKAGFALIAKRAHAPIRLISIRATPGVLSKCSCWWWPPKLPAHFEIELGEEIAPSDETLEITALAHARLAKMLTNSPVSGEPCPHTSC